MAEVEEIVDPIGVNTDRAIRIGIGVVIHGEEISGTFHRGNLFYRFIPSVLYITIWKFWITAGKGRKKGKEEGREKVAFNSPRDAYTFEYARLPRLFL